jgi:hypothetical protein
MERYFTRTMWIIHRLSFLPSVNEQLVVLGVVVKRVTDRMGEVNDAERKKKEHRAKGRTGNWSTV